MAPAAAAAGANLAAYSRHVYVFPQNACGWWGQGTVGGNPAQAWINGSLQLRVVGHELGHNFGLYHSHALDCGNTTLGQRCTSIEYGDMLDIMGNSSDHINAFQKERLGWLNYAASPPVTIVDRSGTYWLDVYESASASQKALKILKSTDRKTGAKTWYYLETRRGTGFDSDLAAASNVLSGFVVHLGTDLDANSSNILDMTPDNTSSWYDPALVVGKTFTDSVVGVTLFAISADASGGTVNVSFGSVSCVNANPTVTVWPSATQWVQPGATVTYTVTVTNTDSSGCSTSSFTLQASAPAGWLAGFGSSSVTLNPGASGSTSFTVTAPATAADGFYTIGVNATNSANTSFVGSASVTESLVTSPCVSANPIVALSPSATQFVQSGATVTYTVTVTNTDSSGCSTSSFTLQASAPAGWLAGFGSSSVTLNPGASGSTPFTVTSPASGAGGSYTIGVTATNSANPSFVGSASVTESLVTSPSVTVTTDQASYTGFQWVTVSATVMAGQSPTPNASVTFTITKPNQAVFTGTTTTGANGLAVFRFRLKPKDITGQWLVQATATVNGLSGSGTTSFMVQ